MPLMMSPGGEPAVPEPRNLFGVRSLPKTAETRHGRNAMAFGKDRPLQECRALHVSVSWERREGHAAG